MPSLPHLVTVILLCLEFCSANPPSPTGPPGPPGPSSGGGPNIDCGFSYPPGPCSPTKDNSPGCNAALVQSKSVTGTLECGDRRSTITTGPSDDDGGQLPTISALDVLINATEISACQKNNCKLGNVLKGFDQSKSQQPGALAQYLCGKLSDEDICCASSCLGTQGSPPGERSLKGVCQTSTLLNFENNAFICNNANNNNGNSGGNSNGQGGQNGDGNGDSGSSGSSGSNGSSEEGSSSSPSSATSKASTPSTGTSTTQVSTTPSVAAQTPVSSPTTGSSPSPSPTPNSGAHSYTSIFASGAMALGILFVFLNVR